MVSDPTQSTRTGDVVRIIDEGQVSRRIHHVISEIVTPWGAPLEQRPALPSPEERSAAQEQNRHRKLDRRAKTTQVAKEVNREPEIQNR